jgi:TetR/AcrR family transcriptional repressor of nem operon
MDMARPKEFNRDEALATAIEVFADHGFEGTSTEALLGAMKLNRQSLYDTYGSKRALYLEALQRYTLDSTSRIVADIKRGTTPLAGLSGALSSFALEAAEQPNASCLGVGAVLEFGLRDADVVAAATASHAMLIGAINGAIVAAQQQGEIRSDIDVDAAADFLQGIFSALKVSARGGMSAARLEKMAGLALYALSPSLARANGR